MAVLPPPLLAALRLTVVLTVAHVTFGGARLALTLQGIELQLSPLAIGVLMSLLMVIPSLVSVRVGRWADRAGFRQPTQTGFAMLALGCALPGLVQSGAALCVAAVLVGTGYSLAHVAVNNAIGQAADAPLRTRAFGITALGFSLSALAGPMVAGITIDHFGHRAAFLLLASLLALPAFIASREASHARLQAGDAKAKGSVAELLRHRPLRMVLVMSALVSTGWDLFTFLAPLHASRAGLSATAIGFVVGAFGVGSFVARLALPAIVRRFKAWSILCTTVVITAAGYFAFAFTTAVVPMLLVSLALGLALGCGQPLVMGLLHSTAPASRTGEAVGLRTAITSVGQTVMPLLFGAAGTALGLMPLFVATAAALAGGGAWLRKRGSVAD